MNNKYSGPYIHREKTFLKIMAIIFIIGVITASASIIVIFSSFNMKEIGTQNYYLDEVQSNELFLNIYNNIGDVDIIYSDNADLMVEINVVILSRKDVDESQFAIFEINRNEENTTIIFDSGKQEMSFFNKKILEYDISITLNPKIVLYTDIYIDVGDFYIDIVGSTAEINKLSIVTKTGNINVNSQTTKNVTINNLMLISTTGIIHCSLSEEGINYVSNVFSTTTTGKIEFDFGNNCTYNGTEINLSTTTGKIVIYCTNMNYLVNVSWLISTTTGSVYTNITQEFIIQNKLQVSFFITVNTGSIEILTTFHEDIGYLFEADTDTGSVSIPGQSTNYDSALNKYYFSLHTSTGDIQAEA